MPKATRNYNSVELGLQKNFADHWFANGSYMWSRDAGNYSGLSSSDENGRDNPNNSRDFDYPAMSFDQTGQVLNGVFDTDRTHQIKCRRCISSASARRSDSTSSRRAARRSRVRCRSSRRTTIRSGTSDATARAARRSSPRPTCIVQHEFKIGGSRRVQLSANVLNLFNQRIVTNRVSTMARAGAIPLGAGLLHGSRILRRSAELHQPDCGGGGERKDDGESAVPDGRTRIRPDPRAVRRQVHVLSGDSVRNDAPQASACGAFFTAQEQVDLRTGRIQPSVLAALLRSLPRSPLRSRKSPATRRTPTWSVPTGTTRGWDQMRSEDWAGAAQEFQHVIAIEPAFTLAHYSLGRAEMALRHFPKAIEAYTKCRELYAARGGERFSSQLEWTRHLEDQILELNMARAQALTGGAKSSTQSQQLYIRELTNKISQLEQARDSSQNVIIDTAVPYFVPMALGAAYFRSGRLDDAEREFKTAIDANSRSGESHNNLAVLYMTRGRLQEATTEVQLAERTGFKVNPQFKQALDERR